jgi:predicted metal-dependent hydrolase
MDAGRTVAGVDSAGDSVAKPCRWPFTLPVQMNLFSGAGLVGPLAEDHLRIGERHVRVHLVRNPRARRYILRLQQDGAARVTIPRGGSTAEGWRFALRNGAWLANQIAKQAIHTSAPEIWTAGTEIYFRGERVRLQIAVNGGAAYVNFSSECVRLAVAEADLRSAIERHLWRQAARELPVRVLELAALHQFHVRRITVRNQRSRWGSCSRRGRLSLNWRLIQTPPFVRDYIILHELAHLREMNHSRRFWSEVERLCPEFALAERWLREHSHLLR